MVHVCPNTFSAQEQSSFGVDNLLCFIFSIFSVACSIAVSWAEVQRGRSGTEFGLLQLLLKEMDSETDYMYCVIIAAIEEEAKL